MNAFVQKDRQIRQIKVPTSTGWKKRTTGTRDSATAKLYQQMVDELGPRGKNAVWILDRVGTQFSLAELYQLWTKSRRSVARLKKLLKDVDVSKELEGWESWLSSKSSGVSADTAAHYINHVRKAIPKGTVLLRSEFTSERVQRFLDRMDKAAPATVRKAGAAFSSAARYLKKRGVIRSKVMADVDLPSAGAPRVNYLETAEAIRLADAQPGQYRNLSALLAGSGIDVSVALCLRRRDVNHDKREIRARGTKTYSRDRIVRVADWAWEYVEGLTAGKLPDALLFDRVPERWRPGKVHRKAIAALVEEFPVYKGYTMRDARHTYAVRAIRAGTPAELVAQQMGHANWVLVGKVYGRFKPSHHERNRWEIIATAADNERKEKAK